MAKGQGAEASGTDGGLVCGAGESCPEPPTGRAGREILDMRPPTNAMTPRQERIELSSLILSML